jgi:hypothetical protein
MNVKDMKHEIEVTMIMPWLRWGKKQKKKITLASKVKCPKP